MSTYLQLCQRARKECAIALNTSTLPTTVVGQVGELGNLVQWVADAWRQIQADKLWSWLWEEATVTIVAGTNVTAGTIPEGRYERESVRIGDSFLTFLPWWQFRLTYATVQTGAAGQTPNVWSIRPDGAFVVDIKPAADVTITVERFKLPTDLAADGDTPAMPADLHDIIMWAAVKKYAAEQEAGVRMATADAEYTRLLGQLQTRCLPMLEIGGPLA